LLAACLGAIAFLLTFFLKEMPLRTTARSDNIGDSFAMPRDPTSLEELERIVTRLADRESRWGVYERLADELEIHLRPDEIWLLGRLAELDREASRDAISAARRSDRDAIRRSLDGLVAAGYVSLSGDHPHLTDTGRRLRNRVVENRRSRFSELLRIWTPEQHADAKAMLERLAQSFVSEPPIQ